MPGVEVEQDNQEVEVPEEQEDVVADGAEDGEEAEEDAENTAPKGGKADKKKPAKGRKGKKGGKKAPVKKVMKIIKSAKKEEVEEEENKESGSDDEAKAKKADSKQIDEKVVKKPTKSEKEEYRTATGVLISRPSSRDVKIGSFSLMSHGQMLVEDTTIELTIGRKYGLIGPNGCGKSTFLKCLAKREVPIPSHMDIFFLDEEAPPTDMTAMEYVIAGAKNRVKQIEANIEKLLEDDPESDAVQDMYDHLDELDPNTFEARAGKILFGLGFKGAMMNKKTRDMSGGWRMRVSLAEALFVQPTLMLLDEPTNHLDLEACVWLENYLKNHFHRCLVLISHSQDFLNGVCTNIIHMTPRRKLVVYGGDYDTYERTRSENEANQIKRFKKEQDDIKHIKDFIASCGTYSNLVRQGKSKQKIIDKMEAKGLTEMPDREPKWNFRFPDVEKLPPPVLAFYDVAFSYDGKMEHSLYDKVNLAVNSDSRVALVGPNGAGKSTLLKLMLGLEDPTKGQIKRHTHLKLGRYHQHSNDALDPEATPLAFVQSKFSEEKKDEEWWRQVLGRFGVSGKMQTTQIKKLSDGQKSRLVFAILSCERPNVLLLDEPTNHLDMQCIDALADAINHYAGGVVLVSHDFRLIDQVAKDIWVCEDHAVKLWNGGIRSYKQRLTKEVLGN